MKGGKLEILASDCFVKFWVKGKRVRGKGQEQPLPFPFRFF